MEGNSCAPGIDEGVCADFYGLMRDDRGHAIGLCIVVRGCQHIVSALGCACVEARERTAHKRKPAGQVTGSSMSGHKGSDQAGRPHCAAFHT